MTQNKNIKIIEVDGIFEKSRRLWLQGVKLRNAICREGVELFFGGGEYIPLLLPQRIKCVVTIHDMVFALFHETLTVINKISYRTLFRLCVRKSSAVITVSNDSKEDIMKYLNIDGGKIFVAYNGIDLEKFRMRKKKQKGNYILFVGTLQPRKNLANLIKAYSMIAMKADVDLVVVGASGWKNHEIRYVVEQLDQKISERIHFYGYIDNETLVELYQKATVFCAPSLHEGFGLIILEALASGTPVVTSRRGAIPEIFGDSVEYADPLSPGDMAEKILQIILDKNIQKKMIDQGKCYSAKYDISSSARKYVYIFESIMKGDCARRESI